MRSFQYINPIGGGVMFYNYPYLITTLKGLDIADINIQEQTAPFQDGTTPIDQLFKAREVVLDGAILLPQNLSGIDTAKRTIISGLNPKAGPGSAIYTNNNTSYLLKNIVPEGPLFSNKLATNPYQDFEVTFHCSDPYLYATSPIIDTIVNGTGNYCINSGDVESDILLTINGPCTNPTITNLFNGYIISYIGTIASGKILIINTSFGNKSALLYTSGSSVNAMPNISVGSVFFGLGLGSTQIEFTYSAGSPTCTISHTNRFIGA